MSKTVFFYTFLLGLLLGINNPMLAQGLSSSAFDSTLTPRTLSNGFRYYLKKNPEGNPKQVDLRLIIKAGAFQEDEDQLGIAHFVEHMAFNGTQNFSQADLFRAFKRLKIDFGPDANATTNFDNTEYRLKSSTDSLEHLKLSLDILYDWASGLKFAATEVEAEKGVLLAEKREYNSPPAQFQQALFKWLYPASRLSTRNPLGDSTIITEATPELLRRFFQDCYRPDLMALVVVGDVDEAWLEKEINARFGKIKKPDGARPWQKFEIKRKCERGTFRYFTSAYPGMSLELNVVAPKLTALKTLEDLRWRAANNVLMGLVNQQLSNLDIVRQNGINCNVGWQLDAYSNESVHTLHIDGPPQTFESAYKQAFEVLVSTAKGNFPEAALDPIRKSLSKQAENFKLRLDAGVKNDQHLPGLINAYLYDIPFVHPQELETRFAQAYQQVSKADLLALAQQWLVPEAQNAIFLVSESTRALTPDSLQFWAAFDSIQNQSQLSQLNQDEAYLKSWFSTPLPDTAQMVQKKLHKHEVVEIKYANGIRVVLKPLKEDGSVHIYANSRGGYSQLKNELVLPGKLLSQVAQLSGVEGFSYRNLLQKTQILGVQSNLQLDQNQESISSSCPKENLEDLLALLHLRLSRPQLEQVALEQVIGMEKRRLAEEAENPYVFFEQLHQRKEHPQEAKLWAPSPEDLDKITLATLRQVYEDRFFNTKDFSFVIVGEVDTQTVFPLLQRYLGSLPACGKPEEYLNRMDDPFPLQALDTSIYLLNTPKAVVEISYFGLREHPTRGGYYNLYLQEWQKILEKALFQELREKRSAIYHVDVQGQFIQAFQDFGFKVWFECEPPRVVELIATTDSIITATVNKKVLKEAFAALEAKFSRPSNPAPPRLDLNYWRFLLDNDATMLEAMINSVETKPIPAPTEKKHQTHSFRKPGAFYPALQKLVTPKQRWQVVLLPKR